ncbi:hypothetical protein PCL_07668 [Purpureocillium lilacinum]|uniref:Uncharacterized protein n=1 Tax=Purpureocillium lilacinum TaxID=33203 RepID=A0A2U3EIL3_PURLI|nr:hypothetical protein Purlil1_4445 [Purpureocillium lilacinum]PWI74354.1 hypothetical protein PCL_07668 [Purpureocillium lilacinum]
MGRGGREFENTSRAGSPSSSPRPDQANADGLSVRRRTGIEREKCACAALRASHLPALALCFMISRHRWQGMAVRASGTWGVIVDVGPGLETLQFQRVSPDDLTPLFPLRDLRPTPPRSTRHIRAAVLSLQKPTNDAAALQRPQSAMTALAPSTCMSASRRTHAWNASFQKRQHNADASALQHGKPWHAMLSNRFDNGPWNEGLVGSICMPACIVPRRSQPSRAEFCTRMVLGPMRIATDRRGCDL